MKMIHESKQNIQNISFFSAFCIEMRQVYHALGTSLAVQWLRLHASNAGGMGSIPVEGTKILQAVQHSQKKFKKGISLSAVSYNSVLAVQKKSFA